MTTIKSPLCQLLGIEYPIFQGAMAWVAKGKLAAAVSEAGGLGIIAASQAPVEYVREQIQICKSLTNKPYCVNLMMQNPYIKDIIDLVIEEQVPIITTGAGNPAPYMEKWCAAGIKVIPVIPNVKVAKKMASLGATAVVAEGMESGGHIGTMTTMALLPQVVEAVDIPVIAAGGIGNGRGIAGALIMGAAGVQMGTAFLVAKECEISQGYKDRVLAAIDTETVVTGNFTGHVVRSLRNSMTDQFLALEAEGRDLAAMEKLGAGALKRAVDGDLETGAMMSGQIAGLIKAEGTCAEIIEKLMAEAVAALSGAKDLLV